MMVVWCCVVMLMCCGVDAVMLGVVNFTKYKTAQPSNLAKFYFTTPLFITSQSTTLYQS